MAKEGKHCELRGEVKVRRKESRACPLFSGAGVWGSKSGGLLHAAAGPSDVCTAE